MMRHLRRFIVMCMLLVLAACIPARVPERLNDTPGPRVVVTDNLYEGAAFTARYPGGWRVVTSEAAAPVSVIFVAPDDTTTIQLMVGALDEMNFPASDLQTEIRGLNLSDDLHITAILRAPADEWETYLPIFEAVVGTVGAS